MTDDPNSVAGIIAAATAAPHHGAEDILELMIPIITIVMAMGIGMLRLWIDYRKKREMFQLYHAERMAAIDKGGEVPPLPPEFFRDYRRPAKVPSDHLRIGLIWLLIGAAGFVAIWMRSQQDAWWGLVPAAFGAANLLFYFIARHPGAPGSAGNPPPPP